MATLSQEALTKLSSAFGQGVANEIASLGNKAAALASTPPFGSAYTQSYSTADRTHDAALTDSTTGSAGAALAAGAGYSLLAIPHTFIGGTSAVESVTTLTLGFKFKIISWAAVTTVALVGSGGSRVANMEIGATDVGTVASTITVPIANTAVGTVTAGTAVEGANTGAANATFSIEIASGGTAFTAGSVMFLVLIQNMDTADAIASLAANLLDLKQLMNSVIDDLQSGTLLQ